MAILNTDSLRKQVYDYLKEELAARRLKPGEFIDQKALQERLGVSKTPLRDSLIQLESEGFVSIIPCRGVVVHKLCPEDVRHIYQIAGALEGAASQAVFPKMTPERLEEMEGLVDEVQEHMARGDYSLCADRNNRFHDLVLALLDNPPLLRLIHLFRDRLYDFPPKDLRGVREWEEGYWRQHRDLLRLFREGTAKEVGDFMREVHWNFDAYEPFLKVYYEGEASGTGRR
jgi:DNA-binding GntR family transcriptional regulator